MGGNNSVFHGRKQIGKSIHESVGSVKKQFVVLANSIKKGHGAFRCIAGREIVDESDGDWILEEWIRPVSSSTLNEGALSAKHFTFDDGSLARCLDVVECHCTHSMENAAQPENWLLDESVVWRKLGRIETESLYGLVDEPANLWLQPYERTDRVAPSYLPIQPLRQSLVLIRVSNGRLHANGKGYRLWFTHNGVHYDLCVTDPRICTELVQRNGEVVKDAIACISLTQPFSGMYQPTPYHYKLVASLFWC